MTTKPTPASQPSPARSDMPGAESTPSGESINESVDFQAALVDLLVCVKNGGHISVQTEKVEALTAIIDARRATASNAAPLAEALRNIRDYRKDMSAEIAARSMRFYAQLALEDFASNAATAAPGDLPEERLNYIARQYFASEEYQLSVKHAISDAFKEARTLLASNARAAPAMVEVGNLCVFPDRDASFGFAYDISANYAGHKALQSLDGATLYVAAPSDNSSAAAQERKS